jgi:hypothetical protein
VELEGVLKELWGVVKVEDWLKERLDDRFVHGLGFGFEKSLAQLFITQFNEPALCSAFAMDSIIL